MQSIFKFFYPIVLIIFLLPFWLPLIFAAVTATLLFPAHKKLTVKISEKFSSFLLSAAILLLVFIPLFLGSFSALRFISSRFKYLKENLEVYLSESFNPTQTIQNFLNRFEINLPYLEKLIEVLKKSIVNFGYFLAEQVGKQVSSIPSNAFLLFIYITTLFFLLKDQKKIIGFIQKKFSKEKSDLFLSKASSLTRSVMLSILASGFFQTIYFFILALIFKVPQAGLWGVGVFLCSFLPVVGAMPILWIIAFFQMLEGAPVLGLIIASFGLNGIDMVVRPFVLQGVAKFHPLIALLSSFGGMAIFGLPGVFLGPIIVGLASLVG